MAVAVESRIEVRRGGRCRVRTDGIPAWAAVVVGVAGIAHRQVAAHRVGGTVAIRVEVQIVLQLVAFAASALAAHAGDVAAERLGVAPDVAGGRGAVAVHVPADGVQLRQGADLDQAVVVQVVVAALRDRVHAAVAQRRVLRVRAEVPRGFVRVAVVVHVEGVPAGEDAGGRRRRLQLRRGAAGALVGGGEAAGLAVPVAQAGGAGGDAAVAGQAVAGRGRRAEHRAGGVAGDDGAEVGGGQAAGQAVGHSAGGRRLRVAGDDDRTRLQHARQAADVGVAGRRAARPDGLQPAGGVARQRGHRPLAGAHVGVRQAQRAHHGAAAQGGEQAGVVAAAVDVQVVDGVAVAVERRVEVGAVVRRRGRADGIPAAAAVVVGVARVAGAARVGGAVAVGVEVQVPGQLVAGAGGRAGDGRAAHVRAGVGERAAGAAVVRRVAGRGTVAVQIPADGVQLRERRDLDEAVVVHVVVRAGAFVVGDGHAQGGGRAVVAAAGGGVVDVDGFVHGVRISRLRLLAHLHRLRRVPVRGGERQRRLVDRCRAGVAAGHRHRRVAAARLRGQTHRVALERAAFDHQQRARVQREGGRVRIDQHPAAVVVRHGHRHRGQRADAGRGERHRRRFVAGVVVRLRRDGHRLRGVPVRRGERQRRLVHRRGAWCRRWRPSPWWPPPGRCPASP